VAVVEHTMQFRALHRFARISATKVRPTISLIRGQPVEEALRILHFTPTRASGFVRKVLQSAVANAGLDVTPEDLYVADARADVGPTRKWILPRARGRADHIRHRFCHITVVVSDERSSEER
jgi:large subunit ribosomal protein L22